MQSNWDYRITTRLDQVALCDLHAAMLGQA
jgi:hypothetical protein